MTRLLMLCWLLVVSLMAPAGVLGGTVIVSELDSFLSLGPQLEYLEDQDGTLTIEDIRRQDSDWAKSNQDTLSFGYTSSAYWIRFRLINQGDSTQNPLLELAYPVLDYIDAYIYQGDSLRNHYQVGDRYAYHQRPIDHPNFIFPLAVAPHEPVDVYLRIVSGSSVQAPLTLWKGRDLLEQNHVAALGQAVFYGAMLIMAMYNLLLFFSIRDVSYLYYVMYVVSTTMLLAGIQGLTFKFLWPDSLWFNDTSLVIALSGMIFFPTMFFREFLAIPHTRPVLSKVLLGFAMLAILTTIGAFFLPYRIMMVTTIFIVSCAILAGFWSGIVRWLDGYHAAKYFNIAWTSMLSAGLILALNKLGILPRNWFTEHVAHIGATTEVVLLSFALAHRMNHERHMREQAQHESAQAQRKLLALQIQANEDLDRIVRERTEELEKANAQLKLISATDGLTELLNRRAFEELFQTEYKRAYREKSALSVIMVDLDHFKKINDQYGHPFGDQCLKMAAGIIRRSIRRPPDAAARYGGEEFALLLPNTDLKGAICVATNILNGFAETVMEDGDIRVSMTASIGIASHIPDDSTSREALLKEADECLYTAKANGRNRIEWLDRSQS